MELVSPLTANLFVSRPLDSLSGANTTRHPFRHPQPSTARFCNSYFSLNDSDPTDQRQNKTLSHSVRKATTGAWRDYAKFVNSGGQKALTDLLPDECVTVEELLEPSSPYPTFTSLAGYMADWASGAVSLIAHIPAASTAKQRWRNFRSHFAEKNIRRAMSTFIGVSMVERGLVTTKKRERTLVSLEGYKQLRDVAFNLDFAPFDSRQIFQFLFCGPHLSNRTSSRRALSAF